MAVAVVGAVVMVGGLVPIKASSGHWPITKWLLSYSMARSVSTHSVGIELPENLGSPAMIMRGAGHFEVSCAPCHSSPARRTPRVTQHLTPAPPALSGKIDQWEPSELFYITKHGVKFTGMPAFPSEYRDDEVWAVVAFLLKLPEMDEQSYRDLVFADADLASSDTPRTVVDSCANCHGFDGRGRVPDAFPNLAELHSKYFVASMRAYAKGTRHSGIMGPIAASLDDHEFEELAAYYSIGDGSTKEHSENVTDAAAGTPTEEAPETSVDTATESDTDSMTRGKVIAHDGLPKQDVGACVACHPVSRSVQNPKYPYLVGQPAVYLAQQLKLIKSKRRGGKRIEIMHPIAAGLSNQQIEDVAAFYAAQRLKRAEPQR